MGTATCLGAGGMQARDEMARQVAVPVGSRGLAPIAPTAVARGRPFATQWGPVPDSGRAEGLGDSDLPGCRRNAGTRRDGQAGGSPRRQSGTGTHCADRGGQRPTLCHAMGPCPRFRARRGPWGQRPAWVQAERRHETRWPGRWQSPWSSPRVSLPLQLQQPRHRAAEDLRSLILREVRVRNLPQRDGMVEDGESRPQHNTVDADVLTDALEAERCVQV